MPKWILRTQKSNSPVCTNIGREDFVDCGIWAKPKKMVGWRRWIWAFIYFVEKIEFKKSMRKFVYLGGSEYINFTEEK